MLKFILLFSSVGAFIPIILSSIWPLLEKYPSIYRMLGLGLLRFQVLVWPSSIFMIGTAGNKGIPIQMLSLSIIANILLYALIGFLAWFGLHKQRWVLFALALSIIVGWYRLLHM